MSPDSKAKPPSFHREDQSKYLSMFGCREGELLNSASGGMEVHSDSGVGVLAWGVSFRNIGTHTLSDGHTFSSPRGIGVIRKRKRDQHLHNDAPYSTAPMATAKISATLRRKQDPVIYALEILIEADSLLKVLRNRY